MPPKSGPKCIECQTTDSIWWTTLETGGQICHICHEKKQKSVKCEDAEDDAKQNNEMEAELKGVEERKLRKSTRSTRYKYKVAQTSTPMTSNAGTAENSASNNAANSANSGAHAASAGNNAAASSSTANKAQAKNRSRRHIFKKAPVKLKLNQLAETHCVESVLHKGSYMQIGDIVSLVDHENNVYYAQIRGLLVDAYSEKSAYLTWLMPTQCSPDPQKGFDPATYLIGPDEEFSRKLSYLEFVMHAPSNYYHDRTTPFPLPDAMSIPNKSGGYIWTRLHEYKRDKTIT